MVLLLQQLSIASVNSLLSSKHKKASFILSANHGRWEKVDNQSSVMVSALDIKDVEYFIIHIHLLLFIVRTLLIDSN